MTRQGIMTITLAVLTGVTLGYYALNNPEAHLDIQVPALIGAVGTAMAVLGPAGSIIVMKWTHNPGTRPLIAMGLCALAVIFCAGLTGLAINNMQHNTPDIIMTTAAFILTVAWGTAAIVIHHKTTSHRNAPPTRTGSPGEPGPQAQTPAGPPTLAQAFLDQHLETWEENGRTAHDWRYPEVFTDRHQVTTAGGTILADPRVDTDETLLILVAFTDGSWFLEDLYGPDITVHSGTREDFHRVIGVLTSAAHEDVRLLDEALAFHQDAGRQP